MKDIKATKKRPRTGAKKKIASVKPAENQIYFPHEIMTEILLQLPAKSLVRFRSVCRLWNSLICDPSFVDAHLGLHESIVALKSPFTRDSVPTISKVDFSGQLIDEFRMDDLPIDGYRLSNSVNGLMCLYGTKTSYLLNLETREYIRLPTSGVEDYSIKSLGFNTCTSEYKVIRQCNRKKWQILTFGTKKWRSIGKPSLHVDGLGLVTLNTSQWTGGHPTFWHGVLHWMVEDRTTKRILSLHMNDEKFESFPAPAKCHSSQLLDIHLLKLDEHLCLADIVWEKNLVAIWKLKDDANRVWTKEYNIKLPQIKGMQWYPFHIMGSQNEKIVFTFCGLGFSCYDPQKKAFTRPAYREGGMFRIYTESFVPVKNWIK